MTETFVTGHMISLIQNLQSAPHMSAPALQRTVDQTAAPFGVWEQRAPSLLTAGRFEARQTPSSCVFRAKKRILSPNFPRNTVDRKMHLPNPLRLSPLSRATKVYKPCIVLRRVIPPKRYNLH